MVAGDTRLNKLECYGNITGNDIQCRNIVGENTKICKLKCEDVVSGDIECFNIQAADVTANSFKCGNISVDGISGSNLNVRDIAANDIAANDITANDITANDIAANDIQVANIEGKNIKCTDIQASDVIGHNFKMKGVVTEHLESTHGIIDTVQSTNLSASNVTVSTIISKMGSFNSTLKLGESFYYDYGAKFGGSLLLTGHPNDPPVGTPKNSVGIGQGALRGQSGGKSNIAIGTFAGNNVTSDNNILIGTEAGRDIHQAESIIAIGKQSGTSNIGNSNVFLGDNAGKQNKGSNNTFGGTGSGTCNVGESNTFYGHRAGETSKGNENVIIGCRSGGTGQNGCTYCGFESGTDSQGDSNVFYGYQTGKGNIGNGNVFIGNGIGVDNTESNKLIIHNTDTKPLIQGNFNSLITSISNLLCTDILHTGGFRGKSHDVNFRSNESILLCGYSVSNVIVENNKATGEYVERPINRSVEYSPINLGDLNKFCSTIRLRNQCPTDSFFDWYTSDAFSLSQCVSTGAMRKLSKNYYSSEKNYSILARANNMYYIQFEPPHLLRDIFPDAAITVHINRIGGSGFNPQTCEIGANKSYDYPIQFSEERKGDIKINNANKYSYRAWQCNSDSQLELFNIGNCSTGSSVTCWPSRNDVIDTDTGVNSSVMTIPQCLQMAWGCLNEWVVGDKTFSEIMIMNNSIDNTKNQNINTGIPLTGISEIIMRLS